MNSLLEKKGYQLRKIDSGENRVFPSTASRDERDTLKLVADFTMSTSIRTFSLIKIVKFIIEQRIPGDFVECGVWRGGSAMTIAKTLCDLGVNDRKIYLYDTFEGMTEAGELDFNIDLKKNYKDIQSKIGFNRNSHVWAYASLLEVQKNMLKTKFPSNKIIFKKGDVRFTLREDLPSSIALLRLDTDFYDSTRIELEQLYPLVSNGGSILIDDYGTWAGCKLAVDEFREKNNIDSYLNILDNDARLFFKN